MTVLRPTLLVLLATTTSILLVSGCTGTNGGKATSATSAATGKSAGPTSTATTSGSSFEGVELDSSKFADKPCDALTPAQVAPLGPFKATEPGTSPLGANCTFRAQKVLEGITYEVTISSNGNTIESITKNVKSQNLPVIKETKVSGYAATNWDGTNAQGSCYTAVGTSSKNAIAVSLITENSALPQYKDPCAATEQIAALVVQNLKG